VYEASRIVSNLQDSLLLAKKMNPMMMYIMKKAMIMMKTGIEAKTTFRN
jgi:hypothetical protein